MNRITNLITWYNNELKYLQMFEDIANVCENSPWHQEKNTLVHTDMVVGNYLAKMTNDNYRGLIAAMFHDVGKAVVKTVKHKPDIGNYFVFHGHEQASAVMWLDYASTNFEQLNARFGLSKDDVYFIGWLIEYHLVWRNIKDQTKIEHMQATIRHFNGDEDFRLLTESDQLGRIGCESLVDQRDVNNMIGGKNE
jgi:hypothetical protein